MRFLSLQNHDPEEELGLGVTSNKRQSENENLETEKYAMRNLEEKQRTEIEEDQREARQEGISDRFRGRKGDILERGDRLLLVSPQLPPHTDENEAKTFV